MLSQDFKEFIESLNNQEVKYLVVGGYAVAFHGHPRYTKDLDILLECTAENAQKILSALAEFGFSGLTVSDFTEPGQVIQLGYPPNRIDLLTSADGIDFESAYKARVTASFDKQDMLFIDIEHLKKNKIQQGGVRTLQTLMPWKQVTTNSAARHRI